MEAKQKSESQKKKSTRKPSSNGKPIVQKEQRESQSTILVRLAREGAELFHDDQGNGFARILLNGGQIAEHNEFHKLRSSSFRRWIRQQYLSVLGTVPSATAVSDALENLEGLAEFNGDLIEPRVRVGGHKYGTVWLDLGRAEWEPIIIGDGEWTLLSDSTLSSLVKFHRPKGFLPLPVPEPGGDLEELRSFLNLPEEHDADFILIVSWLLGALMPSGPYPILCLYGEQGSAKSTTAKILKSLIDPAAAVFRSYMREERDLVVSASNSWVLVFDNMSGLPVWMSDALCRISTGGGFCTRMLYTGREEEIFNETRPVILNGISDVVDRHDLLDRCIFVTLPPIPDHFRKSEKEVFAAFSKAHPRILGSLLTAVSAAIKNKSKVKLGSLPRMADFALWVVAAEPSLPWSAGAFLDAYTRNRANVHRTAIEADLFASSLVEWFRDSTGNDSKEWTGKSSELGGLIEDRICNFDEKKVEALRRRKEWPSDGTRVSKKLRHLSGFLRRVGIEVVTDGRRRKITVRSYENSVSSVHSVNLEEKQAAALHADLHAEHADENLACNEKTSESNEEHAEHAEHAENETSLSEEEEGTPF